MNGERQPARLGAESDAGVPPARSAQVRALFDAALDLPPERRLDYVRARCTDAVVLHEVESLLAHEQRAGDEFLKPPSAVPWSNLPIDRDQPDPFIGARVGAYTIRRMIAEGGMGAVYLAEQDRPRREVALKIMTDGFWSRSARRRFEFETEILGRLHHPNIAQVYEAGVADVLPLPSAEPGAEGEPSLERESLLVPPPDMPSLERKSTLERESTPERESLLVPHPDIPSLVRESTLERESLLVPPPAPIARVHYFAMEYIPQARPITVYCDEENLDLRGRLRLIRTVCDAVHYGHQNGVIHRDLKPDNILIDAHGHVKIIDFGVARSTDCDVAATMHTEAGQLIGTLAYMSPEQCAADPAAIDTRSDVYSLGAVLFELLTGGLPYDVSHLSVPSATRIICDQPPARPSDVARRHVAQPPPAVSRGTGFQPVEISRGTAPASAGVRPVDDSSSSRPEQSTDALAAAEEEKCQRLLTCASRDARVAAILPGKLRGDLDTIILKCLEKDRSKRYHSVAALADDIERHLSGEPISARPPTRWTKAVHWAGRRPKLVVSLACLSIAVSILGGTLLSMWFVFRQPYKLVLSCEGELYDPLTRLRHRAGDRAELRSLGGSMLRAWHTTGGAYIGFAAMADRPARWGGGKVVMLGFNAAADSPYAGKLCILDAARPHDEPIHTLFVEQEHIDAMPRAAWPGLKYDSKRQYRSRGFGVKSGWMLDVFPGDEHPGDEIVSYFHHSPGSQGVLRIYNLNGELLFQAWQDGGVSEAHWFPQSGRLVLAAIKGDKDAWDYGLRIEEGNHPRMLLAIGPKPGQITNAWINPHAPDWGPAEWYRPIWCKAPCPRQFAELNCWFVLTPASIVDGVPETGAFAMLRLFGQNLRVAPGVLFNFNVILDSDGRIVRRNVPDDLTRRAEHEIPDTPNPSSFDLLEWTGLEHPCIAATSQPGDVAASTRPAASVEPP